MTNAKELHPSLLCTLKDLPVSLKLTRGSRKELAFKALNAGENTRKDRIVGWVTFKKNQLLYYHTLYKQNLK